MNVENLAQDIKDYLIDLAINDKLPMDLNDLDVDAFETIIKEHLPTDKDKMLAKADEYLCPDDDMSLEEMVEAIANHFDKSELIDYVHGVVTWEKVELEFTCQQFLDMIGYVK
jgi:hypothetical protein